MLYGYGNRVSNIVGEYMLILSILGIFVFLLALYLIYYYFRNIHKSNPYGIQILVQNAMKKGGLAEEVRVQRDKSRVFIWL